MGSSAPPNDSTVSMSPPTTNGLSHTHTSFAPLPSKKPIILHLGDPIQHNLGVYERLLSQFHIINPPADDLERSAFEQHLREGTWGDFSAIMRPFWRSGNAMAPWNEELIKLLPDSMRVMASAGAGYDWVKDRCLAEHGIIYCNGAHASTESVADTALWLIITVFRHMTASSLAARSCSPRRWREAHNHLPTISHNPRGHTLGIVGLGNIGFAVAQKARAALGMKILYTDLSRKLAAQESQVDANYYPELTGMLPHCDCVLLATPAGPPLLTASTLRLLPRGSRVVNIARGSLIDETALANALDSGHIDAAGLDVHAHEPQVNERLARMPNVEVLSHTGGGSIETNVNFELLSMENCERVLNGRAPLTAVNLKWLRQKASTVPNGDDHRGGVGGVGLTSDAGRKQDLRGQEVEANKPTAITSPADPYANTTPAGSTHQHTFPPGQSQLETAAADFISTSSPAAVATPRDADADPTIGAT